tara:strand:+ start:424 stop:1650 length:1227 start_codon:yes stop_codon:yes gene_type:complete
MPCLIISAQSKEETDRIKQNGRSTTRILQTYRFDELLDDGSYTIKIDNISSNVNIVSHEGSGAKITIKNITIGISEKEVKKAYDLSKIIVKDYKDQEVIQIVGSHSQTHDLKVENFIEMDLPKNVNLEIQLLGGDISLNDIQGESILETLGGDIQIDKHKGRIETKTEGGNIDLKLIDGVLKGHSFGGSINLLRSKGNLSSSSIGGDIRMEELDGIIESQTSGGSISMVDITGTEINCQSSGGDINCNDITGDITIKNSGQGIHIENANGNLDIESTGGDIFIKELNGSLKCEASIGDIILKNISGTVESLNANGDILLDLIYDSSIDDLGIDLVTHSGDITLSIPKELPINLKSTIYQSSSEKDLNSEMPMNISILQDKVVGSRKVRAGTIPINLEAHQGLITIKEN